MTIGRVRFGDLYRLDFADGKSYIGACVCGAKQRYKSHQRNVNTGSTRPVHKAWREYSPPKLVLLKRNVPIEKLWVMEKKAIIKYNTLVPNGYNGHNGCDFAPGMFGKKHTKESRKKQSVARKGKPFTEEHKRNIGLGQLGKKKSAKHCEKNRISHLGKKASDETKAKMSAVRKGKKHTEESKELIRQFNIGRKMSQEANEKNRHAHLRENLSEETRERMRLSALNREARKRAPLMDYLQLSI